MAAQLGARVVTVWSSKDDMGYLHSFDARNHDGCVGDVKVTENKVVLLLVENTGSTHQLVVPQEGEQNWENKILEPFSMPSILPTHLVVDTDRLAVAGGMSRGQTSSR